jgi:hypothetical protein
MTIIKTNRLSWFVSRECFTSEEDGEWRGKRKMLMCAAVGLRGTSDAPSRDVLRGTLRSNAKRTLDCAMLAPGNTIHMRSTVTWLSIAKGRCGGSDQPLHGPNLIREATLNVLEPGDHRKITAI